MNEPRFNELDLKGLLQVLVERSASREELERERGQLVAKHESMDDGPSRDMVLNQIDDRTTSILRLSIDIGMLWEQAARGRKLNP